MSNSVVVYGTGASCAWCVQACNLLEANGMEYTYHNVREDDEALTQLRSQGLSSVPQIFVSGKLVGGFKELKEFLVK